MSRTLLRAAPVAAVALALAAPGALAGGRAVDHADVALNIVPSGQYGAVPTPAGADTQARMYDGLTPLFDKVSDADLRRYFKSERFGTAGECPCRTERVPRSGVRLVRDKHGVPHYLDRDLRRLLGDRVSDRFANRYCGAGDLAACRTALWDAAGAELEAAQGGDPAAWRSDAVRERIPFVPGLLPYTMRYTNRPSGIQQVISFDGHRPR